MKIPSGDLGAPEPAVRTLGAAVARTARAGLQRVESEALRPLGLSYSGYGTLLLLWLGGPHGPWELARLLGVAVPSISSLLNTLERQGYAKRERSPVDRRLVIVTITDSGIETACKAYSAVGRIESRAASALSSEEQKAMQGYLERYLGAIGELWAEQSEPPFKRMPHLMDRYRAIAEGNAPPNAQEAAMFLGERTTRSGARRR